MVVIMMMMIMMQLTCDTSSFIRKLGSKNGSNLCSADHISGQSFLYIKTKTKSCRYIIYVYGFICVYILFYRKNVVFNEPQVFL